MRSDNGPIISSVNRHENRPMLIAVENSSPVALSISVFDQNDLSDGNGTPFSIARSDFNSALWNNHILSARRRMPSHVIATHGFDKRYSGRRQARGKGAPIETGAPLNLDVPKIASLLLDPRTDYECASSPLFLTVTPFELCS